MRVLIYGDPHINKYPQGLIEQRRESELELFKEIYENIAESHNVDLCVCLGDFLHNSYIQSSDMDYLKDIVSLITKRTYILTGNHDRSTHEDSALSLLPLINNNIIVVKDIIHSDNLHLFISHGWLKEVDALNKYPYIYTHEDYKGLVVNTSGYTSKSGHSFEEGGLKSNAVVFNGHIHHSCEMDLKGCRLINVGAVSPVAFGELESMTYPKVYILDTDTNVIRTETVKTPLLPVTCTVSDYDKIREFYKNELGHVRLRVSYTGDLPELEHTKDFLSIEYKKIIEGSVEDTDSTVKVEDMVVNVPEYIDSYLESDKNLNVDDRKNIKFLCDRILSKV